MSSKKKKKIKLKKKKKWLEKGWNSLIPNYH